MSTAKFLVFLLLGTFIYVELLKLDNTPFMAYLGSLTFCYVIHSVIELVKE